MAVERIARNPHFDTIPDHAGLHYNAIRTILVNTGITNEQAVKTLDTSWINSHEERIQAWDQQVIEDEAAHQEERRLAQEQDDQQRAQQELELENERREVEKRKLKMNDFDENAMVDDFIGPRPSAYALRRLAEFEYAELWYFTQEGCADAMHQRTHDVVSSRPVSALKASKNVVQDADLTWRQMEMAKITLFQYIAKCGWAEKAVTTLAQFFMNLGAHHYRERDYGEHALLSYQARVRRDWHDGLELGAGFNIAIINETLLQSIYHEIMNKKQVEAINEMRTFRESLVSANTRAGRDELRTPRYKPRRDQPERRQFNSSGRSRHPSRSRSPSRRGGTSTSSPPPYYLFD